MYTIIIISLYLTQVMLNAFMILLLNVHFISNTFKWKYFKDI